MSVMHWRVKVPVTVKDEVLAKIVYHVRGQSLTASESNAAFIKAEALFDPVWQQTWQIGGQIETQIARQLEG
jgi:hypothetical protein